MFVHSESKQNKYIVSKQNKYIVSVIWIWDVRGLLCPLESASHHESHDRGSKARVFFVSTPAFFFSGGSVKKM